MPLGPPVCALEFYALLRINRIRNFMLFGEEEPEPWLAEGKVMLFLFSSLLPIPPGG